MKLCVGIGLVILCLILPEIGSRLHKSGKGKGGTGSGVECYGDWCNDWGLEEGLNVYDHGSTKPGFECVGEVCNNLVHGDRCYGYWCKGWEQISKKYKDKFKENDSCKCVGSSSGPGGWSCSCKNGGVDWGKTDSDGNKKKNKNGGGGWGGGWGHNGGGGWGSNGGGGWGGNWKGHGEGLKVHNNHDNRKPSFECIGEVCNNLVHDDRCRGYWCVGWEQIKKKYKGKFTENDSCKCVESSSSPDGWSCSCKKGGVDSSNTVPKSDNKNGGGGWSNGGGYNGGDGGGSNGVEAWGGNGKYKIIMNQNMEDLNYKPVMCLLKYSKMHCLKEEHDQKNRRKA